MTSCRGCFLKSVDKTTAGVQGHSAVRDILHVHILGVLGCSCWLTAGLTLLVGVCLHRYRHYIEINIRDIFDGLICLKTRPPSKYHFINRILLPKWLRMCAIVLFYDMLPWIMLNQNYLLKIDVWLKHYILTIQKSYNRTNCSCVINYNHCSCDIKFDIYVFITITGSITLLVDY